ncbi:MAG TPA: IucA/IucC family protein [Stenotrophomonas sp.]|nr:IucA/IucC family protein [Stenotrophomonas sp.]
MPPQTDHDPWYLGLAHDQACACWLNCYLREFALPRGTADLDYRGPDRPGAAALGGRWLRLDLAGAGHLCTRLLHVDKLGRCRFGSVPYLKRPGSGWRCLDSQGLARCLLQTMGSAEEINPELVAQSENSVAITALMLQHAQRAKPSGDWLLDAEQSMVWGHALHPTPKSREGLALEEVAACSPEARTSFPLFWFRVDARLRRQRGRDVSTTLATLCGRDDLYPCHPWEAQRLLDDPLLQQAQAHGWISPVGPLGESLFPTSSVRTLFHPGLDYFLKCSVHVRMTNCVRKNAWYELESAVAMSTLLAPTWAALSKQVDGFGIMLEPAATSLDFSGLAQDPVATLRLAESFGILYRQAIPTAQRQQWRPQVAGALFTRNARGDNACVPLMRQLARQHGDNVHTTTLAWFGRYAGLLLDGAWHALFDFGIVLEPHLQNTLIGFSAGWPARVWVRDLEGTKLIASQWPAARLAGISERVRESLHYSAEQGWNRVAYCTLVNNLAEAIFHLADGDAELEQALWDCVGDIARRWQKRNGPQPELQSLLQGAALPGKNNLGIRVLRRPDRQAGYTQLPNPIADASRSLQ